MAEDTKGKLHFWDAIWDLRIAECPCDVHFCDWLEKNEIKDASIFHFGTGSHHIVGIRTAENGSNNCVLGITASPGEYDAFVKLAIDRPEVEKTYKSFFGDIYQLEPRLLPEFDVVTLFHLCEFRNERNDAYAALTDLEVVEMLTDKTRPGGYILFYTKSFAFDTAEANIAKWEKSRDVEKVGLYETLLVYRKKS
ncbi:MAG: hypothetical protein Q7T73_22215 [Beijerinckiaceae bacterium]|jgi:hypothetical protein|nr:hypothetical protein [Beijerinckiaceae bacterium]